MRSIAAVLALMAVLWYAADRGLKVDPGFVPVARGAGVEAADAPQSVQLHVAGPRAAHPRRDLFAYAALPVAPLPPPMIAAPVPAIATPVVAAPLPDPTPAAPPPPQFTWRYLGHFGPATQKFAAFARDGEVRNARVGERIDDAFVLRSIAADEVEAEHVATKTAIRIPLAAGSGSR